MSERVPLRQTDGHLIMLRPDAAIRLLVFHHAAGSAMSFAGLARSLSALCEPVLIELPGRGNREREPHAESFKAAVADLRQAVQSFLDRPAVVLGHSLGALLAHSILCELPDKHRSQLQAVIVSSAKSPETATALATFPDGPFRARTRESLLGDLDLFGGIPADLLADPEVHDHAVTLLGYDLHLADTYCAPQGRPAEVPYEFWFGAGDTSLDRAEGDLWTASVGRPVRIREFGGGHFYLQPGTEAGAALNDLLAGQLAGSSQLGAHVQTER